MMFNIEKWHSLFQVSLPQEQSSASFFYMNNRKRKHENDHFWKHNKALLAFADYWNSVCTGGSIFSLYFLFCAVDDEPHVQINVRFSIGTCSVTCTTSVFSARVWAVRFNNSCISWGSVPLLPLHTWDIHLMLCYFGIQ